MKILNLECFILPSGNKRDVIPLDATVSTIFLCGRNAEDNVFHMNVLHVPPKLYKKNISPMLFITALLIFSNVFCCSSIHL